MPSDVHLPTELLIFDERSNKTYEAEFRWRRNREVGLYFRGGFAGTVREGATSGTK